MNLRKRDRRTGQRQRIETKTCGGQCTDLSVMLREACVYKCGSPKCVRIRLWSLKRENRSRVLIGAARTWRCDWCRWDVGVLLLALAREAIDSTVHIF